MTDTQIRIMPETEISNKQGLLQMNVTVLFSEHR